MKDEISKQKGPPDSTSRPLQNLNKRRTIKAHRQAGKKKCIEDQIEEALKESIFKHITITCPSCKKRSSDRIDPNHFNDDELRDLKNAKCRKCSAAEKRTPSNQEFLKRVRAKVQGGFGESIGKPPVEEWMKERDRLLDSLQNLNNGDEGVVYHWLDRSYLKNVLKGGLKGVHNLHEHEPYVWFMDLNPKDQKRIWKQYPSLRGDGFHQAVTEALRADNRTLVWVSEDPYSASSFGDVCVEIRIEGISEWGVMYHDNAFGWGLLLDSPIRPKYISVYED